MAETGMLDKLQYNQNYNRLKHQADSGISDISCDAPPVGSSADVLSTRGRVLKKRGLRLMFGAAST